MLWERPWLLLLLLALPAIVWLALRARAPLGGGRRALLAVLQCAAWAALTVALAGPWRTAEPVTYRLAIAAPGADADAIAAWREATPHDEPFRVVTADLRPRSGALGDPSLASGPVEPDLGEALRTAANWVPPGSPADIAVFGTAGDAGRGLRTLGEDLLETRGESVRVHWRGTPHAPDGVRLLGMQHAPRATRSTPFPVTFELETTTAESVRLEVRRDSADGEVLGTTTVALGSGTTTHDVIVRGTNSRGLLRLHGSVVPEAATTTETVPSEARSERSAIWIDRGTRVLALTDSARAAALTETLAPHGVEVDFVTGERPLGAERLANTDVVVIDDLAAASWDVASQDAVRTAVLEQGCGLLLAGREANPGPGGYSDSPLADILPVETPQREERRDPSVALVLIVDTSGSMGNRIELAKEVARLAIRRLMPHDKAGIVEFYGSKRWAAPLQPAANVIELLRALNRLQAGGGTVIYSAIEESYYALLNVRTRFKHVLVLTDGGVESGPFEALARKMAASGINLNTVLIGPQANSPFLLDLAQWGRGRFYACPSRFQLPDLRFKEPQTTLLPALREGSFPVRRPRPFEATASLQLEAEDAQLRGLVDARPRPFADVLLETGDGADRPLLVAWDQGAGRSAVLASDLLGAATADLHPHGFAPFLADLLRSLAAGRAALRPNGLEVEADRDALRVSIDAPRAVLGRAPTVRLHAEDGTELARVTALDDGTGKLRASLPWPTRSAAVRVSVDGLAESAGAARPLPRQARLRNVEPTLVDLATRSGGSLTGALPLEGPPPVTNEPTTAQRRPAMPWLARGAILAFLASILVRRWPARRSTNARAASGAASSAAWLLGMACGFGLLPIGAARVAAQEPAPAEAIEAELRRIGHLDDLRQSWSAAPAAHRAALLLADGDLTALRELLDTPAADFEGAASLRALVLEATGDVPGALAAATEAVTAATDPANRASWLVRRAQLRLATANETEADAEQRQQAASDLRAAVAEFPGDAEFARAIGLIAGSHGLDALAVELHRYAPQETDAASAAVSRAAMRRAQWAERIGDVDTALADWLAAAESAELDRERGFALSRALDLAGREQRLAELTGQWSTDFAAIDSVTRRALLDALREQGRGVEALDLLDREEVRDDEALQSRALALAIAAGSPDRALEAAKRQLDSDPRRSGLRVATALLLTDLRRRDEASRILEDGFVGASRKELLRLTEAAAELGDGETFQAGLEAIRARGTSRDRLDALLLEVTTLRGRQQRDAAAELLLEAREQFEEPADRVRLGEALESLGRVDAAIELYRQAHDATGTEDLAFRLGWLLASSKDEEASKESAELFRTVWLEAGSRARRVQAEERVLDLAAREGRLADLVLELEEALADPETPNRTAKREALVKIWSRAQDTFGAREVLMEWAREEPEHRVEAWQRLAQIHLENQEFLAYDRAVRHLLEIDPDREIDYRQQLALGFLERGRPTEARAVIQELLDGGRADAIAFEFSAGILSLAGRHRDAAKLYRRALATHPDRIETLLLWANSMAATGDADRAIGRFLALLCDETIRDDLFLVAVDGLLNLEAGRDALRFAARATRRRLAVRPRKVYLHRGLQDLLEALDDAPARLASLDQTLVVAGLQRTAWLRELMDEADRRRDTASYLRHSRALLRSGEEVPPAVFLEIGEVRLAAGDLPGAERAFERARLAPDFATVERRVAELYVDAGRLGDAERVRRRILRRDPDNPGAILAVAEVLELRGSRNEALAAYVDAGLQLLAGLDIDAGSGPASAGGARRNTRNRSDTGPTWEEAFEGALRCGRSADDLLPLRRRLAELAGNPPDENANLKRRLELVERLAGLALAFGEDPGPGDDGSSENTWADVARLEAELLAASGDGDAGFRKKVFEGRLARGDLEAARELAGGFEDDDRVQAIRRLALLSGQPEDAASALAEVPPGELFDPIRDLVAIGRSDLAMPLYERVVAAAEPPEPQPAQPNPDGGDEPANEDQGTAAASEAVEPDAKAVRILPRVRALLGIPHDDSAAQAERLRRALEDDSGALRARVSRRTAVLRNLEDDAADATRSALRDSLRALISEIVSENDDDAAWALISSSKSEFEAEELAPLVPVLMAGVERVYTFPSRAEHLDLMPVADAVALAEETLDRFEDAEVRSLILRMLALDEMPAALQEPLLSDLRLRELQPADANWLARIAVGETELDETAGTTLLEVLRRDRADDPRTSLLAARLAPAGSVARREAALRAANGIRTDDAPDYSVITLLDGLADFADDELADSLLGDPRDATADLLLRAQLLLNREQTAAAADLLILACGRAPDNLSLLNRAQPVLLDAGRRDAAIELYLAWAAQAAKIYIFQAAQVADLLIDAGRAIEAVELLERAEDPGGSGLRTRLRAILAIDDAAERAPRARAWLQDRQANARSRRGNIVFGMMVSASADRLGPAAVLDYDKHASLAPADADAAATEGDLLAFLPEGFELSQAVLRSTPAADRDRSPGLYRGLVGAAQLQGTLEPLLESVRTRLAERPGDAESLRVLLAAGQRGAAVEPAELQRALARRTLATGADLELLLDAVPTAIHGNLDAIGEGLLAVALAERNPLANYRFRESLQPLMRAARDAGQLDRLIRLAPPRGASNAWLDGDLLSTLALSDASPTEARAAWDGIEEQLTSGSSHHWFARMALPYAGLCLRDGDHEAALAVLQVDDPQLEFGDRFQAVTLAASVPPLETWNEPVHTPGEFADALLDRLGETATSGQRALWFRCAALLAIRLEAAGRTTEALALRERLRPLGMLTPNTKDWLQPRNVNPKAGAAGG